jgi:hypothetical protein
MRNRRSAVDRLYEILEARTLCLLSWLSASPARHGSGGGRSGRQPTHRHSLLSNNATVLCCYSLRHAHTRSEGFLHMLSYIKILHKLCCYATHSRHAVTGQAQGRGDPSTYPGQVRSDASRLPRCPRSIGGGGQGALDPFRSSRRGSGGQAGCPLSRENRTGSPAVSQITPTDTGPVCP